MRPLVLTAVVLAILAPSRAGATSCGGKMPFLRVAAGAEIVFLGRLDEEGRGTVRVETIVRGRGPSALRATGVYLPNGARGLFALTRQEENDVWGVPMCAEGALVVAGAWAFGEISRPERIGFQAARVDDVIQALLTGKTTLPVVDAREAVPFADRGPAFEGDVDAELPIDCVTPVRSLTTRALVDDQGLVVWARPFWSDVPDCVRTAGWLAIGNARIPPMYQGGLPTAFWIDLRVRVPVSDAGPSCGSSRPLRPPTAVVAFDGHRMVITARPSSLNLGSLPDGFTATPAKGLGRLVEIADLYSAPRLAEFRDDDPCSSVIQEPNWAPGTLLGKQSILDRSICASYGDDSECAGRGVERWSWLERLDADDEAVQITGTASEPRIPAGLFAGDVVLLMLTPGTGVRPRQGPLHVLPERLIVDGEAAREWPALYAAYLDGLCRGAETVVLEWAANVGAFDVTFVPDSPELEEWRALGASWYGVSTPAGRSPDLTLTRLRILRRGSGAIHLALEDRARNRQESIWARHDAPPPAVPCKAWTLYENETAKRREQERRNRALLTQPLATRP